MPHELHRRAPQRDTRPGRGGSAQGTVAGWLSALDAIPWANWAILPLWLADGIAGGFLLAACWADDTPPWLLALGIGSAVAFGMLSLLLARPSAGGRIVASWIVWLMIAPRWWYPGRSFQVSDAQGSGAVCLAAAAGFGCAAGETMWMVTHSAEVAWVVGAAVAVGAWVWTLFLFPGMDE